MQGINTIIIVDALCEDMVATVYIAD
jgi:hypothetical protein